MAWYATISSPLWLGIDGCFWLGLSITILVVVAMNLWWWTRTTKE